ncbi:epoxide hydrolase family protein [Nocardiopsis sp. NRRL B-16309]|uniref:epoxide hydrolase family protein n=1 Tax=Nocardiopsis sp. NRRL B-16309 TaxID=1519494 RepID=UPI0006AEC59C|nr:epoxide hydrolase [Nocardiopsis sp. NRRL B-16309]
MRTEIVPARIDVPQDRLDDLADRLRRTRRPDALPDAGADYGVPVDRVERLRAHWLEAFDWRALEDRLNAYPQFTTEIDGANIHFLHVRSSREDATPLVITHGWPGSVLEYLNAIDALTEPESPQDPAFHVVLPSMPGFGFSGPTRDRGWDTARIARAWVELMDRLGYESYGAMGNDGGSMVSPEVGRLAPGKVVGVHVTQLFSFPSGDPAEFADLSEEDQAALAHLQWFYENKFSFNQVHSQQPLTLAYALADSPAGLLAWNSQLMDDDLDDEFVVANAAVYWLTGTAASSIRFYYENARAGAPDAGPTTVPTALAMFEGDFRSIRAFAERDHRNIVRWNSYGKGGHYAAHAATDTLVRDVRRFFAAGVR